MSGRDAIPPSPGDADYAREAEAPQDIFTRNDPFALFGEWLAEARKREPNDPNAMALATADAGGMPDVRMVLLKDVDARGFVFYTNTESAKGEQLAGNARAALCFHWKSLRRQVRVRGAVSPVSAEEADAYFDSRARDSRIGAWASAQSRPLESRFALEKAVAAHTAKYHIGPIPRPPHWSGYRIAPVRIEFWRDRAFRLHDRMVFERDREDTPWRVLRLYP
ncbi:pyridoxamine 5'-phosphate oxidase [Alkalicaulis satelles]|uniref:Pyridoxine/pyridoxamine 5'-phosphate oxidase n=1 Tax=Alkalicaulis satelles TaxID=2609175 RepID=A0A5M6ZLJ1_9PROT|nr:pyridoxamine 5'-phosphate oxidase [Alkalicaulis satelles]KAA5804557.1 pyridoxamine 5'-phosphate oxidase [Alkalicaulis satelles]